ncbi:sialidase family protein [Niabella yanshanensis]|uniref:exo-alpha-sialidase n=1 Tax=Niabella yanshanensis TaxID=577386 RepID=A0ABZ0W6W4_9BACT|nr:sialidase family protein [Niabella yanshanensis]WQD38992.1 sialidase family protein [Niabella yanshanensis]
MMRSGIITMIAVVLMMPLTGYTQSKGGNSNIYKSVLWEQGKGKYKNYRIPAVIATKKGTVLAFCEAREAGDTGDIDLLVKRSKDNGKTWSEESVVWNDEQNTCGNPCPVVDMETGRIWLVTSWNDGKDHETAIVNKTSRSPRLPFICYSDDDGLSWSKPVSMGAATRDTSWGWYATGPGIGIQVKNGAYKGRLVIPANHSYNDPDGKIRKGPYGYGAHVLYSDDHGASWKKSESIKPGCNESQVTELADGTLMMNMRSYNEKFSRAVSTSKDGGATWSAIGHDYQLTESICQASILNFGQVQGKPAYLFLNPAVSVGRTHMTLKTSFDNCRSWSNSKLVYAGPCGYSSLTRLPNGRVGIFIEAGKKKSYEKMIFVSFPAETLFTAGAMLQENDI